MDEWICRVTRLAFDASGIPFAGLNRHSEFSNKSLFRCRLWGVASPHLWHFVECVLENSPGWWAYTVATSCLSRPTQLSKKTITKYHKWGDAPDCSLKCRPEKGQLWPIHSATRLCSMSSWKLLFQSVYCLDHQQVVELRGNSLTKPRFRANGSSCSYLHLVSANHFAGWSNWVSHRKLKYSRIRL